MESEVQRSTTTIINALFLVGSLGFFWPQASGATQPAKRIHANAIDDTQTFVMNGHIRPAVAEGRALDLGEVSSSKVMPRMFLHFSMTAAQQADLTQLLAAQQNRRSPQFHKFLTPETYAARFGLNTADIEKITLWLETNGFSNVEASRGRNWISFSGTAGQVQAAMHTSIHNYTLNGEAHIANATDPQFPKALQGIVAGMRGLHNFNMKPHIRLRPNFTSSVSGSTYMAPDDWATIYDAKPLYSAGLDGSPISGETYSIVVVGQSDVQLSDLAAFRANIGLSAKPPTVVVPPGDLDPGIVSADEAESDLDLEWAGAIAKNGNILFVTADSTTDNGVIDSIAYAINNNVAPILSTSYGYCEAELAGQSDFNTQDALYKQANAQGMTVVAASGDAGAADCDTGYPAALGLSVDFPGSSQYVTSIGGTTLTVAAAGAYWSSSNNSSNGSALQYIPEVVWNDTSNPATGGVGLEASGGGASIYESKPSWQTGTGVPSDGHRDVPDIAFAGSPNQDGLLYCGHNFCTNGFRNGSSTGNLDVTGGTSAGPPPFAGVLAMLVQKMGGRLGNVNPNLYSVAQISTNAFHDITSGNNIVPCRVGTLNCTTGSLGYSAGVGYDQTTGLGSLDVYNTFQEWSADIQITASPTSLSIQPGATGTATINVSPYKNFSGTVSFSCAVSSGLANVTCSVPSTTVTTSGSTTVTVTAASTAGSPFLRFFRKIPPTGAMYLLLAFALAIYTMRKKRFTYAWAAAAFCVFVLGAVSCGGGSSSGGTTGTGSTGPVAESGTVTVTATSGSLVNSVVISVVIP
jgi:subtilase family serine protease